MDNNNQSIETKNKREEKKELAGFKKIFYKILNNNVCVISEYSQSILQHKK